MRDVIRIPALTVARVFRCSGDTYDVRILRETRDGHLLAARQRYTDAGILENTPAPIPSGAYVRWLGLDGITREYRALCLGVAQ